MHDMAGPSTATGQFVHHATAAAPILDDEDEVMDDNDPRHAPLGSTSALVRADSTPPAHDADSTPPTHNLSVANVAHMDADDSSVTLGGQFPSAHGLTSTNPTMLVASGTRSNPSSTKRKRAGDDGLSSRHPAKRATSYGTNSASSSTAKNTSAVESINGMTAAMSGMMMAIDKNRMESDGAKLVAVTSMLEDAEYLSDRQRAKLNLYYKNNPRAAHQAEAMSGQTRQATFELLLEAIENDLSLII